MYREFLCSINKIKNMNWSIIRDISCKYIFYSKFFLPLKLIYIFQVEDLVDKNFYKEYQGDKKGDVGYHRKKAEKHNSGYELFDSFHKKHGDDYAFDNHDKGKTHNGKGHSESKGGKKY